MAQIELIVAVLMMMILFALQRLAAERRLQMASYENDASQHRASDLSTFLNSPSPIFPPRTDHQRQSSERRNELIPWILARNPLQQAVVSP
jgi:hypothetical protein